MASLNKVILLGNLTKDPELKRSPSGMAVAKLRIAVNEQFRERSTGQLKEVACYVDVMVWDRQAEACGQFLQKGSQVIVDGRLAYDEWKTPAGEMRNKMSVRADRVQFLNNTKKFSAANEDTNAAAPQAAPQPPPPQQQAEQSPVNGDDENLPF